MFAALDLLPWQAALAAGAVALAGFVRGFSGFGLSAIVMLSLALFLPPAQVVPLAYALEISASLHMLPGAWRDVDWRLSRRILIGGVVGTPLGMALLVGLPPGVIRGLISGLALGLGLVVLKGYRLPPARGPVQPMLVGLAAGAVNGAAAVGGMVVALFMLSVDQPAARIRASIVLLLFVAGIYSLGVAYGNGLVDLRLPWRLGLLLLPMAAGIWLGQRFFRAADGARFRRYAVFLLIGLAVVGLGRALV